jgi:hypothetical protein
MYTTLDDHILYYGFSGVGNTNTGKIPNPPT